MRAELVCNHGVSEESEGVLRDLHDTSAVVFGALGVENDWTSTARGLEKSFEAGEEGHRIVYSLRDVDAHRSLDNFKSA